MVLHDFDLVFCVESEIEDPDDLPFDDLIAALEARIADVKELRDREAFGHVGTYE